MKQFRHNVFETNSSSCHTFTWAKDPDPYQDNYIEIDEEGYLRIPLIGFCSTCRYDTQSEKLAYAVQLAAYKSGIYLNAVGQELEDRLEELYQSSLFNDIEDEILSYIDDPKCIGIRFYEDSSYGYIDDAHDYYDMQDFYEECGGLINFVYRNTTLHYYYNG